MNNLKALAVLFIASCFGTQLIAQEHTIKMSSGTLMIREVNRVNIVGHSGSNVIITSEGKTTKKDERADGLKEISAMGYSDNTGIGLAIKKHEDKVYLNQISTSDKNRYTIKVPASVTVNYEHSSWEGKTLNVTDFAGELDVSANYNNIKLVNVTGPMSVNTVFGGIEAIFESGVIDNGISLISVYQNVDVTMPSSTKANFRLKTSYGKIFTDLDLKFDNGEGKLRELTNMRIEGTLNGGGSSVSIKATYKNIYLRGK